MINPDEIPLIPGLIAAGVLWGYLAVVAVIGSARRRRAGRPE